MSYLYRNDAFNPIAGSGMEANNPTATTSAMSKAGGREGDTRLQGTGGMAILQEAVLALSVEITKLEKDIQGRR